MSALAEDGSSDLRNRGLPCILLSAQLDDLIIEQARLAEAFSVLAKPVTLRQITGIVQQALERTYHWRR